MNDSVIQCLVLSDFNVSSFCGYLSNNQGPPAVRAVAGPYGQVIEPLMDDRHPCWNEKPEAVIIWSSPEMAVPSFRTLRAFQTVPSGHLTAEVDRYTQSILRLAGRVPTVFVPTWALPPQQRGLGMLDLKHAGGAAAALLQMNARLVSNLRETPGFYLLDTQRWIAATGPKAFSQQMWYMAKVLFGPGVFKEAVADLKAAFAGLKGEARKLLLLDLDDTLWGGIIGDVGWEQLKLGGHDPIGEAFVDFQRAILALKNRGVLLGIISRNEESVALAGIRDHPEMVLRLNDLAGWRINWKDKAQNIVELVEELRLGLQSVVYIDDDPGQRQRVRTALPDVFVPDWPNDKMLYLETLGQLRCFDMPAISKEDTARADMYVLDRQRKELAQTCQSVEDWLKDLQIHVQAEVLNNANLPRAAQLFNKTNQMNLSSRRLTAQELWQWSQEGQRRLWTFRMHDRFGDCGLVGIASLEWAEDKGKIIDFVLSCRAFGRRIEETMLDVLFRHARTIGLNRIEAHYQPSAKNKPCLEFFVGSSGFDRETTNTFTWDAAKDRPLSPVIQVSESGRFPASSRL